MALARVTQLSANFTSTTGLPRIINYPSYFASVSGILGWFDWSQSGDVTVVDDKVSAVAARVGTLGLAQGTALNRPTFNPTTGRMIFDKAATQYMIGTGAFPTTAVTVAAILRRSATSTSTEGVIGATTPTPGSQSLYFQASGKLRYRVTNGTATTFQEPAGGVIPLAENVLVIADYDQATDQARCRIADGEAGTSFVAAGDITMNTGWNLGALTAGGGSPGSFEIADLFVFDSAMIGSDVQSVMVQYAREIKGAA